MPETSLPLQADAAEREPVCGFTVADLCKRWRVGPDKVHGFLRRGELVGVNLASNLAGRPQWRITVESVERFEKRRSSEPAPKVERRRRVLVAKDYFPGL
jgi:hypothetical protein